MPIIAGCRAARTVFDLRPLEMNDEPFLSQLSVLMHASVLCGVHGAGLANIAWLRPGRGALVEVQHNAGGNHHYQQMATWLGHDYRRAPPPPLPPLPPPPLLLRTHVSRCQRS